METRITNNKQEIYSFLSKSPELQLYTLGDLDDFFWPYTTWYALYDKDEMQSVALLYTGMTPSTLLLFHENETLYPRVLLQSVRDLLPETFNVHLTPGLVHLFGIENILEDYGQNFRMILRKTPEHITDTNIRQLGVNDLPSIESLLKVSYPDNWFDGRMVETGKYFGYFDSGMLAGIAGIHVYSPEFRIAALGNITTHPDFRGKKIAYKLTSRLCCDLKESADIIGLNVKSDNRAAIKCYEHVGFEIKCSYDECFIRNVSVL